ncbi:PIG-L deacetylase family protein [Sphingomonas bacterium]|uniref:PIG-L deacetylase family protein n=1 Tax=Sphingomonas bacterium TaxID=1895847 RepID=UPI0020C6CABE|nr:PIG-L family deacetylase [Sphingomonas bacterium]
MIAPHPDDESIGAWALMAHLRSRGTMIRVLVVTDGAASHPGSRLWPRARLIRERQRETRRAMRIIGIGAGDVAFLGLPDGALPNAAVLARRRVGRAVTCAPRPLLLIAPEVGDDHADHRATARAAAQTRGAGIRRLAYPVWPAGRNLRGARALILTGRQRLAKRQAIRSYRTQAGRITDDPSGFAMSRAQIAAFSRAREMFVECR